MDKHNVVQGVDFDVAKIQSQNGVMTATGTHWGMAPKITNHLPYDGKVIGVPVFEWKVVWRNFIVIST